MKIIQIGLLLVTFCLVGDAFAQKTELGVNAGAGFTSQDSEAVFQDSPDSQGYGFYIGGIALFHTLDEAVFSFTTGLNYVAKKDDDVSLQYLRIPLGIDANIGKVHQAIIGGGIFGSYLIKDKGFSMNDEWKSSHNEFQFGAYLNLGFAVQINDLYNLGIRTTMNFDITPMYTDLEYGKSRPGDPNPSAEVDVRSRDLFLSLTLKRRLGP